jgi:hypothetical protein
MSQICKLGANLSTYIFYKGCLYFYQIFGKLIKMSYMEGDISKYGAEGTGFFF